MALGVASTGTAISTLSGVAAYNATMAAIGGGSLAAGGLGMAILQATVAAPVLAVIGWAYANHGENALENARKARKEVDDIIQKFEQGKNMLIQTEMYAEKIRYHLHNLFDDFNVYFNELKKMNELVEKSSTEEIKNLEQDILINVQNGYALAAILTDIITTPIFKFKMANNQIVYEKDIPVIEKDANGFSILDSIAINKAIEKNKEDKAKVTFIPA